MFKHLFISSLTLLSIFGSTSAASAENLQSVTDSKTNIVYQVDLDDRTEYTTGAGWRHVEFLLSTNGDTYKHRAIAACSPYQIKSEYYNLDWLPTDGGYPPGSVGEGIAKLACSR
jgi:hypothetical protein